MIRVNKRLSVAGTGYWSDRPARVTVTNIEFKPTGRVGLLNVYFDTKDWLVERDGLIYTDPLFLHELKHLLVGQLGLSSDIGYSEQGMQGDDYVNLDVGTEFVSKWNSVVGLQHA